MLFGHPVSEIAVLALAILAGGVVTGLMSGLFGIGGGAVIVPVLYEIFRILDVPEQVRMQLCVGTSLAIIVPTTMRSYRAHLAKGLVLHDVVNAWKWPAIIGVIAGSVIAAFASPSIFKSVFAFIAMLVGLRLLLGRDHWRLGDDLPGKFLMRIYGLILGLASSLMGIGGGAICNTILPLYNKPIHNAVAVSAALGAPIALVGAFGYMIAGWKYQSLVPPLSVGFVSLIGFVLMAPVSSTIAPYGARLAHALSKRQLEIAYGTFMILVATRFFIALL
ncbi:MAG: sulfite exporter TauE/SafE family protein [Pseudorhodoplanes sp.]